MSNLNSLADASGHYCARLVEASPLKFAAFGLISLFGWLSTPGLTQAAIWLLIADWGTGLFKSMLRHQINSDSGVRGAIKTLIYLCLLAIGGAVGCGHGPAAQVGDWIAIVILYTEATSNVENLDAIATHFQVEIPLLKRVLSLLRMKAAEDLQAETKGE